MGQPLPRGWWGVWVAGILSALIVPLLIVDLGLVSELLTDREVLMETKSRIQEIESWAGKPNAKQWERPSYRDRGLMPLIYRHRNDFLLGDALTNAYVTIPALQSNVYSLLLFIVLGVILASVESLFLILLYRNCRFAAVSITTRLRKAIYEQAARLGPSDRSIGGTLSPEKMVAEQIPVVQVGLAQWWRAMPRSIFLFVSLLALALWIHLWLTFAALIFAIMAWRGFGWLQQQAKKRKRLWEDRAAIQNSVFQKQLHQVAFAFRHGPSDIPGESYEDSLRKYEYAERNASTSEAALGPIVNLVVLSGVSLILFLVGFNILQDPPAMTFSGVVMLGMTGLCLYFPTRRFHQLFQNLPAYDEAAGKVFAFLDREPSVTESPDAKPLTRLTKSLQVEAVNLSDRRGRKRLNNLAMTIPARGCTALMATDADLPMTIAGLLLRFYDPAAGKVLYDDVDVRHLAIESLRHKTAMVTGEHTIVPGTVWYNIGMGDDRFTQLQMVDAAKQSRAYNFIQQLPQGFSTELGENGTHLNVGQSLRIGLARAVLHEPLLVVIQEPEETLDESSAGHIDEAIRRLSKTAAVLLLPTRISTLRSAEQVLFFHEGKLSDQGKHSDLIQNNELYRHITYVRFNEFREVLK